MIIIGLSVDHSIEKSCVTFSLGEKSCVTFSLGVYHKTRTTS
jgi:hypothetical protein